MNKLNTAGDAPAGGDRLSPIDRRPSFLMHRINAELTRVSNPWFRQYGLDLITARILVLLLERDSPYIGDIVELTSLPQSTVSHQIKRLEKAQYVRRRQDRADNRSFRVLLTKKGRRLAVACNKRSSLINEALLAEFDTTERTRLLDYLARMHAYLASVRHSEEFFPVRPDED